MMAVRVLAGLLVLAVLAVADATAPDHFQVTLNTTVKGGEPIVINVTRAWAPLGVDHFHALLLDQFYNEAAFFRVVPSFVVQFGIAGVPAENQKWKAPIKDDPVLKSNVAGTVTYATAGPNTRTTQLFINNADNAFLDKQGFAPFGSIVSGLATATKIFNPTPKSSSGVDQDKYSHLGNTWIKRTYPDIDFITTATITTQQESL